MIYWKAGWQYSVLFIALFCIFLLQNTDEKYRYMDVIYCKDDYYGFYEYLDYDYLYVFGDVEEDEENEKYKGLAEAVSSYNWACNADIFLDLSDREVWTIPYAGCNERTTYHSDDIINVIHKSVLLPYDNMITKEELRELCEEYIEEEK